MFMASLAKQRRERGLAASVINIAPLFGIGYIAEHSFDTRVLKMFATMPNFERDFHQLSAEAVKIGHPRSCDSFEIATGVRQVQVGRDDQPKWSSNPIMSHYLFNRDDSEDIPTTKSTVLLKAQLLTAQNHDEVFQIVRSAFLQKLGLLFQFDFNTMEQANIDETGLDELGMDSLVTTENRTWLVKHTQVNFPILRILSGISI